MSETKPTRTATEPLLIPPKSACALLGISRATLYAMFRRDELRLVRIGGKTMIPLASVREFAERADDIRPQQGGRRKRADQSQRGTPPEAA